MEYIKNINRRTTMKLFTLYRGRSKNKLRPVMTDSKKKCENYRKALKASAIRGEFFDLKPAENGATIWRRDTSTKWTNYNASGPKKIKT